MTGQPASGPNPDNETYTVTFKPGTDPEIGHALREVHDLVADDPREIVVVGRRWAWDGRPPALR